MKKLLFLFTTILLPMIASADESGTCGDNLTWTYVESTKTLTISGSGDMDDQDYVLFWYWTTYCDIAIVVIENGVTSIGYEAFSGCSSLTSVTIPNSVTFIAGKAFDGCKLENIFTKNSKTAFQESSFSDRTYQHAMLYIPEGTWSDAVYEGDWYLFNNIRETTVDAGKLSASRAYMLMDTNTFGYAVYDDASNEVKMAKAFYSIDEQDLNNCWQVKTQGGQNYLYNLGAKEYASVSADGRLTLSAVPSAVRLTETDNGITLGSDASHQWAFVKNGSQPDVTGIEAPAVSHDEEAVSYYSLGGQRLAQPRKGLVIKKTADGKSKKIMVR